MQTWLVGEIKLACQFHEIKNQDHRSPQFPGSKGSSPRAGTFDYPNVFVRRALAEEEIAYGRRDQKQWEAAVKEVREKSLGWCHGFECNRLMMKRHTSQHGLAVGNEDFPHLTRAVVRHTCSDFGCYSDQPEFGVSNSSQTFR